MAETHEQLVGGLGRNVYYRAKRLLVRQFLDQQEARLGVEGVGEFPLHDMSMNGMSFFAPNSAYDWQPGNIVDVQVVLQDRPQIGNKIRTHDARLHREIVFTGKARIARADGGMTTHVGLQIEGDFLDLPQLQWSYAERMLRRDLIGGHASIRDVVPLSYRQAMEHATFFFQFYKQRLNQHETRYSEMGDAGQNAMLQRAPRETAKNLRPTWLKLSAEAAEAMLPHLDNPLVVRAAKKYTETLLTPLTLDAPFMQRAYGKPLGYAGDYQTMAYIYRNAFEGTSLFSRVFHKFCCEHPLAEGVRSRKDFVAQLHEQEYDKFASSSEPNEIFRATNVGAGPAREVVDFVTSRSAWERPIHWTLIDQEEEALSLAHQDIYPKLLAQSEPRKTLRCMYMSFGQFLADPSAALAREPQHLIYSTGLFDYIQERGAVTLIQELYAHLAPGGLIAVANALKPNTHFWLPEFIMDWSLLYRDQQDMLRLANTLPSTAERNVFTEGSGAFHFLLIRKP